jgi:hypothetical protein
MYSDIFRNKSIGDSVLLIVAHDLRVIFDHFWSEKYFWDSARTGAKIVLSLKSNHIVKLGGSQTYCVFHRFRQAKSAYNLATLV